jgi:hypothetical protein
MHDGFSPPFRKYVDQYTCTIQKVPENSEVQGTFHNYGSSVWNLFHVTFLVHRTSRWLPDFIGKLADPEYGDV